jgi:hypothetical protein
MNNLKTAIELVTRHSISALNFVNKSFGNNNFISVNWAKPKSFADKKVLKRFSNLKFIIDNCLDLNIFNKIQFNIDIFLLDAEHMHERVSKEFSVYKNL